VGKQGWVVSGIHARIKQSQNYGTGWDSAFTWWVTVKSQLIVDGLVIVVGIWRGRRAVIQLRRDGIGDVLDFLKLLLEVINGR